MRSLLLALLLVVCGSGVSEAQLNVRSSRASSEAERNAFARNLVLEIRRSFGSDAILTLGSASPPGYDFSDQVRNFAKRAAIGYTNSYPDFIVAFEIERVDGYFTGPSILNFILRVSLVRPMSTSGGAQIMYSAKTRGRCQTGSKTIQNYCHTLMPDLAEEALYALKRP